MTTDQNAFFQEHGYLPLKGALSRQVEPLREHVFAELKRQKVLVSGKVAAASIRSLPVFQQIGALSQLVRPYAQFDKLISDDLLALMNSLAGARLGPASNVQVLLSPPRQGVWTLQGLNWHRDLSPRDPRRVPGVQAFILLDDVAPQGGATLAIAGSQRLDRSSEASQALHGLLRRGDDIDQGLHVAGLSLLEMAGRAGDLYLMDMRLLHTPSVNASGKLRMMATARYLLP